MTKAQKTFNRLVAKVEKLRDSIDEATRQYDEALAYYGEQVHPRRQKANALRKDLVRAASPFLDSSRLKKRERQTLGRILGEQLDGIAQLEGSLVDEDLRGLFQRIHGIAFEQAEREDFEQARSMMEDMFGSLGLDVDLSEFQPGMSEEEFAERAARMSAEFEREAEEFAEASEPRGRRKSKRQLEREARESQAEEARKRSIASVYKQLARGLHPDLEPDASQREVKARLMQELTVAYRNNDLHTLLRLELEWIHREEGDLDRLTAEKLAIYNQVLKEQVQELECRLDELPLHPRYTPIAELDGPFGIRVRTDGPEEARRLDETIANIEAGVREMRSDRAFDEIRATIRSYQEEERVESRRMRLELNDVPF